MIRADSGRARATKTVGALAALAAMLTIGVSSAQAAPGSLTFQQTFSPFQLNNASDTVVSPDGKHVYATAFASGGGSVVAASRNPANGQLTFIDDYLEADPEIEGIGGAEAIAISPDGKNVYVAGFDTDSIARFDRNATTGELNMVEAYVDGNAGITNLGGAMDVAVSPDGLSVYATGFDEDGLVVFGRNQANGALTFLDAEIDGANGVDGLDEVRAVQIAPDGKNVYTISEQDSDVTTFTRFPGTGTLAFLETDQTNPGTTGSRELAISPDNANVYVAADVGKAVSEWDRSPANGALTAGGVLVEGPAIPDLGDPAGIQVAPDGNQVYVTSDAGDALLTLDRAAGGALSFRGSAKDGVGGVNGLGGADGLSLSPDGTSLYVAGSTDDRVAVFSRELAPPAQPPVTPPAEGLAVTVKAKKKQTANKLAVKATCSIACEIAAKAKGKAGGDAIKSKSAKGSLAADAGEKIKLKFSKSALRTAKGEDGKVTITVKASAGGETKSASAKVRLIP
jgi:DNA-binding beta-propeller fold protein YncE